MQKSVIKSSFIYSLKRTIPILVGFFPVGVAYGLMMSAAGYGVWWTAAASLFVYTGATQKPQPDKEVLVLKAVL